MPITEKQGGRLSKVFSGTQFLFNYRVERWGPLCYLVQFVIDIAKKIKSQRG
jgi:hypothetical protein